MGEAMKTKRRTANKGFIALRSFSPKAKRLRSLRKKAGELEPRIPPSEDKYADEDTALDPDSAPPVEPIDADVQDELSHLDGFRDWQSEQQTGITYGDY